MLYNTKKRTNCILLWEFLFKFAASITSEMHHFHLFTVLTAAMLGLSACSSRGSASAPVTPASDPVVTTTRPQFSADSAYSYVAGQCSFGPRVPGTEAQVKCAEWLQQELRRHGATVTLQQGEVKAYNGKVLPCYNIVGSYNPDAPMRVLLMSHWDSRHVADQAPEASQRQQPVMGANDGASGVGVLLELARLAGQKQPQVGIDLFLTDVEDYGAPDDWAGTHDEKWWAMGTQLWCKQMAKQGYRAQYGILLDMVGSPDATFYREYYSDRYAQAFVSQVWSEAARLGYGSLFIDQQGGGVTDDHVFINRMLNIPCIDIIDYRIGTADDGFCPQWHTTDDTMEHISAETLGKVGKTLVNLLW